MITVMLLTVVLGADISDIWIQPQGMNRWGYVSYIVSFTIENKTTEVERYYVSIYGFNARSQVIERQFFSLELQGGQKAKIKYRAITAIEIWRYIYMWRVKAI